MKILVSISSTGNERQTEGETETEEKQKKQMEGRKEGEREGGTISERQTDRQNTKGERRKIQKVTGERGKGNGEIDSNFHV